MLIQRIGYVEPRLTEEEIEHLVSIIKPGYTIGSYEQLRITSVFIKGEYDHVAMVTENKDVVEAVGDEWYNSFGKKLTVIETYIYRMMKRPIKNYGGVRRVGLRAWLYRKHDIFIAKHNDDKVCEAAGKYCVKIKGNYDYAFKQGDKNYSCVEICKESYASADYKFMAGNKMPLPVHFMSDKDMTVLYDSKRVKND